MRLKCIKLAGFKSFVDPTTVNFPSNMAAVVGPNGCGKSNIIDAVRWVMGESSAKNLRGESMTDVIFNGSTSRKPVSQASIELVFDNSDGTLVGEYAAYAEISIRRKVTRDSQNSYYLNGTKCRRRDITDIFLGTGLGPRSYSIIEQGMISKLIEAKPEDLRNFIEEAAGISKYKERRRETENRIRRTHENLARLTDLREELERQLERLHRQAQAAEKYQEYKAEERQLKAQLSAVRVKVEQLTLRRTRLDEELAELGEQRAVEHEHLGESRLQLQDALDSMAQDTEQREVLQAQRDALRERLDRIRQDARQHKDHSHQLAVRLGSLKAQYDSTRQALERLRMQSERLTEKREQLSLNLEEGEAPLEELRLKLEELLERRMVVDDEMRIAKNALEDADRELREAEKRRTQAEQQSQLLRGQLEQQRLEWQSLTVRRTALQDQLHEDGYDLHGVLATLTPDASEQAAEQQLESIAGRIQRLGAINLAAIDEYQQQSERKRYLDAQDADLVEALDTLENVIRKIDKETRNRFKDTFDQINSGIQALFPKVFGGGSAYLELTGEDLLDTGVTIMARPPGKKNSTIHLLSGGEKALTALALVFAIFKLNPAPFCMLDEVDAPLDDANVGRYARLVKEMSQTVQFIYITHNKIAMEMADQLMGVTMHEPGCSRLVAVDVEQAMALVDA
ncbi:Chromosome segregation protein SMC [Pseudomonas amygdali pv. photiniae]|uniref:Chromosome partition protein Smc n=1 Tax=Pseudomonas amygdali pv. photiniae TaxID=251724 RepID=A0A658KET6_PSEA0|nr:Chromosome segregation protein SMC [Pseudomonas amygdali pv. photiniae]